MSEPLASGETRTTLMAGPVNGVAPAGGDELQELAAQFDSLLAGAPLGIGIFDRDCRHVRVNAVLAQMNGRTPEELAGRTPAEVNGDVGLQAEALYRQVMADGVPMRGVRLSGEVSARPGDVRHWDLTFHPIRHLQPVSPDVEDDDRTPGAGVVGLCVIVDDVTVESELAEQVAAASARIEQITESMAVGYLAMDADWRITYLNAQAVTALGRPRQELVGGIIWELFPDTAGTAFEAGYRRARTSGQPFTFDAYYPLPLDAWYEVRAAPEGEGVALYFTDITARVQAQRAAEAAARRAQLLAAALQQLAGLTDADEALAVLPQLLVPAVADWAVVTTVGSEPVPAPAAAATAPGVTRSRTGTAASEARGTAAGPPAGASVGAGPSGSGALAEHQHLASAALGRMRDVAFHHSDPTKRDWLAQYALTRMDAYRAVSAKVVPPFVVQAMMQRRPSVPAAATAAALATLPPDSDHPAVRALSALAPASLVVVPLVSRGRTLGLVTLCWDATDPALAAQEDGSAPPPPAGTGASPVEELGVDPVVTRTALAATGPTPEVVDLVGAIADRAATAIDAIAAAQQQLEIAERLQRSLLTAPPEPDHAHIVVRYVPAAAAAQVGGDWYDAFIQPAPGGGGATVLVIGDVLGHDTDAAAAMGQVRTMVRCAAVMTGHGPAQVLSATDAAMRALAVGTTATAVVARLEQDPEQVARAVTTLRWSNAGHPPAVVLDVDGSTRLLSAPGGESDLLLGIVPDVVRHEHVVELARGCTVLLYTDGLVERRGESLEVGLARLEDIVREVATAQQEGRTAAGLGVFCDEVLARMLPSRPSDDVALIAVRLHPQDRPRPAEAGQPRIPQWVPPEPAVLPVAGDTDIP